jgi:hypothetical protein
MPVVETSGSLVTHKDKVTRAMSPQHNAEVNHIWVQARVQRDTARCVAVYLPLLILVHA